METEVPTSGRGQIYVAGSPISKSVSPRFHRFVFKSLDLPWTVSLLETVDAADLKTVMQTPDFVGVAVSLPIKTAVAPFLDRLDDDAKAMGSVNTIHVRRKEGRKEFVGANTDWKGMTGCILSGLGPSLTLGACSDRAGVVIGGGVLSRTATYALRTGLGLKKIYLVQCKPADRESTEKIWEDDKHGSGPTLVHVDSIEQAQTHILSRPHIVINAVRNPQVEDPEYQRGQQVGKHIINSSRAKEVTGDAGSKEERILLDMASFRPGDTDLTVTAEDAGWKVASFVDFMAHQATHQNTLWTGASVDDLPPLESLVSVLTDALLGS